MVLLTAVGDVEHPSNGIADGDAMGISTCFIFSRWCRWFSTSGNSSRGGGGGGDGSGSGGGSSGSSTSDAAAEAVAAAAAVAAALAVAVMTGGYGGGGRIFIPHTPFWIKLGTIGVVLRYFYSPKDLQCDLQKFCTFNFCM